MFADILESNDFSIIVDTNPIIPPMITGKYQAKVTKIYDHIAKRDVH